MEKVSQEEINRILWKACDTFRGAVDAADYKNYILVMLFLKYISDVWQDHYKTLKNELGDNEELIMRRMNRERFKLKHEYCFTNIYEQRDEANIGEIINIALEYIEEENKQKLDGVFRNIDFNSEANLGQTKDRNKRLRNLLDDFNDAKLDLRPSRIGTLDIIGNAYEYLISKFAAGAGKKAGEFYTPPEVSTLLAKILAPTSGERICDPTCGSGSLLIKCGNEVSDNNFSLFGQENTGATWALCKMNMFLHNMDRAQIEWGDTINTPKLIEDDKLMKFEVVVANPPFSLDKWGADTAGDDPYNRFYRGVPPKSKGDYAFISHMIETITEDNGRVGVVIPHGVLFRGSAEGKIRQHLIETDNLLDTVIGLASNLFYGVSIPVAILIFKKGRKSDDGVLFIDASKDFADGKNQNKLRDIDIERILNTYKSRETIDKYSYLAQIAEIRENDFNLNIPRFVDTFEEEAEIDIDKVQCEIEQIEEELSDVRSEMKQHLEQLGINN